jgi:hypothetical protein
MSIFDINGILKVQNDYLADLAQNAGGGDSSTGIKNLQDYLDGIYNAYTNSNASVDAVLTQQTSMKTIIDNENNRLNAKKDQIDQQLFAKERMAELNDNYKKRQSYINSIFLLLVFGLIIFIIIIKLKSVLTFIPESIFEFLIVILISFIGISIVMKFLTYRSRDNLDFDKLRLGSMPTDNKYEETRKNKNSGNLIGLNSDNCIGESCCVNGTEWNSGINKCVPSQCLSTNKLFDTNTKDCVTNEVCSGNKERQVCGNACILNTESCSSGFSCMNGINTPPFTPTEFSNYSLYK